jgi:arabinofuranan 3-O-arabinosyltransferase
MFTSLFYSILIAIAVQRVQRLTSEVLSRRSWRRVGTVVQAAFVVVLVALVLAPGYPIATGAVVSDSGALAPSHVNLPDYWSRMAAQIDRAPTNGSVLVLPPDDFYQMPFTWGFYGSDGFILNLIHRHVVMPVREGYFPSSRQLADVASLTADSILKKNWTLTKRLMGTMRTSVVLVREDIDSTFRGRQILSPRAITAALVDAPNFRLIAKEGPLKAFELQDATPSTTEVTQTYATVNSDHPNLGVLSVLPRDTHLVSMSPLPGVTSVLELPLIHDWQLVNQRLSFSLSAPAGWQYRISEFDAKPRPESTSNGPKYSGLVTLIGKRIQDTETFQLVLSTSSNRVVNGDFRSGDWGPVNDCNNQRGPDASSLFATVLEQAGPDNVPALQLSAVADAACVAQDVQWNGGVLVLKLLTRQVLGNPPRICVWEVGPQRCAQMPPLSASKHWTEYSASITPDEGTTSIKLFLYADAGPPTVSDYTEVRVVEIPSMPRVDLVGTPERPTSDTSRLAILHTSFSTFWRGPKGVPQVRVDGLLNGWLPPGNTSTLTVEYWPDHMVAGGFIVSGAGALLAAVLLAWQARRKQHPVSDNRTTELT